MVSTTTNSVTLGYPAVPFDLPDQRIHRRQIAEALNRINRGKFNATLDVTLNANTGATLITDNRISFKSAVSPAMALSRSAALAIAAGIFFDAPTAAGGSTNASIVAHHTASSAVDQTIRLLLIG